jgi:hypothetical protein
MEPKFIFHEPPRRYSKACIYGDLIFLSGEDSEAEGARKT